MSSGTKKRRNSFRKFIPSLFLSKDNNKNNNAKKQQPTAHLTQENKNIYEKPKSSKTQILSSTENLKDRIRESNQFDTLKDMKEETKNNNIDYTTNSTINKIVPYSEYPEVYYHSVEDLTNQLPNSQMNLELSQIQRNPVSVNAEIRKVSNKYLISPKKESEVQTNKPKRARSLVSGHIKQINSPPEVDISAYPITKTYNYSAPTSPVTKYNKVPSIPKQLFQYDNLRKKLLDSDLKLRSQEDSKLNTSYKNNLVSDTISKAKQENHLNDPIDMNVYRTRKNVEAFYWNKIRELKIQEDEYLCKEFSGRQKVQSDIKGERSLSCKNSQYRSVSLPRCDELYNSFQMNELLRKSEIRKNLRSQKDELDIVELRHLNKINPYDNFNLNRTQKTNIQANLLVQSQIERNLYSKPSKPKNYSKNNFLRVNSLPTRIKPSNMLKTKISKRFETEFHKRENSISRNDALQLNKNEYFPQLNSCLRPLPNMKDESWHGDPRNDGGLSDGEGTRLPSRNRSSRRDDPRRHTLSGNHLYLHPHHANQINSHGMEPLLSNNYQQSMLFDDDPGIMSEVETSSTGFRRGGKQRSSLPVVRTPSKTLERPLGLVFLQYRNETKRALLPNEITSIDTVKALFVRSFPKQLTMQYLDSPMVKIYIHDSSKDMFYELEDVRAHLRDIRDRSVLRLFESADMGGGVFPGVVGVGSVPMPPGAVGCSGPSSWDQDQNYFSEPEIDSEYHHQHVHNKSKVKAPAYYMGSGSSTLPRGGSLIRAYSPASAPVPPDRVKSLPGSADPYISSPERGSARGAYEDPYYTQYLGPPPGARSTITPIIDEESGDVTGIDDNYQMYGVATGMLGGPRPMPRTPYDSRAAPVEEMQRLRVEKMERQLANLTGLVQKALQVPGAPTAAPRQEYQPFPRSGTADSLRYESTDRPPKLGKDKFQKSVSFEKSVSFSDDPPDMNSPKQHSPQHSADTKPTKPAIKSSTLPRTSSQERDRLKPAPPPKPIGLVGQQMSLVPQRTTIINVAPEFFMQLQKLHKQSRDLMIEVRNLRRTTLAQAMQMRSIMADSIIKIGALAATYCEDNPETQLSREEEIYRQDMLLLENDLYDLEATVERLRGQAANRETRVNMTDIERIAMVLSKSSKTVAGWKLKFPILQDTMKVKLNSEMEKVIRKEKLLEEEPERLELALRRCKKLTGTLVTLKRLACVQEQRLPLNDGRLSPSSSQSSTFCSAGQSSDEFNSDSTCHLSSVHSKGSAASAVVGARGDGKGGADVQRSENALDALLDELQTFAKPSPPVAPERSSVADGPLRRLHSYPSGSDTDASPPVRARGYHPSKPPVPERHPELLAIAARRPPPPPPPRITSRSPLASPTDNPEDPSVPVSETPNAKPRQALLEHRHQELLKKQKALQEQYARLQMIQRSGPALPASAQPDLKKTGSESNLLTKMSLNLTSSSLSGSMNNLNSEDGHDQCQNNDDEIKGTNKLPIKIDSSLSTTNKVYETDIL